MDQPVINTDVNPVAPVVDAQPDPTKPWQSKTMWASLATALIPIVYPPAAVWIAANPQVVMVGLGAIFGALRLVSHGKVTIK